MTIATCPYCTGDVRFTASPKMGELAFCPACTMAVVVVWLAPVLLEDASQMYAESGRSIEFGRSRERVRRRPRREMDEDRDDFDFGRKRRGFEGRRRREGNRPARYYDE